MISWLSYMFFIALIFLPKEVNADNRKKGVNYLKAKTVHTSPVKTPKIALFLSVKNFKDSFWPSLKWTKRDAQKLSHELMVSKSFDQIIHLPVRRAKLKKMLNGIAKDPKLQGATVLFYISSHGTLYLNSQGELEQTVVLQDSKHNNLAATTLTHSYIRKWFNTLGASKKVIIMATCHSGLGKSRLTKEVKKEVRKSKGTKYLPLHKASEGSIIISAASFGETAMENDRLQHDVYTYFFIEAFEKGDRNNDGAVVVTEAHDYAKVRTYEFTGGKQLPTAESKVMGIDNIILKGSFKNKGIPVLFSYSNRFQGMDLYVNGRKKGTLPMGVAVVPGYHKIELKSKNQPHSLAIEEINININKAMPLEEIFAEPKWRLLFGGGYYNFGDSYKKQRFNVSSSIYWQFALLHFWTERFGTSISFRTQLPHEETIRFFKSFNSYYQEQAFGGGLYYKWWQNREWELSSFLSLLRNSIDLQFSTDGYTIDLKSADYELQPGFLLQYSFLRSFALFLMVDYSITSVEFKEFEVEVTRQLWGMSGGWLWQF